ncbi:MAG: linear amide C-N hydrolase [Arcobacter sp.]|nr:linear amide C-N hydrolase [Arcobacter sp.]
MKKLILFILLVSSQACSIFDVKDEQNHTIVARNFDWDTTGAFLWAKSSEDKKYGYFFITSQKDETSPFEGINEKGLFVAISAVPTSKTSFEFKRPKKSLELITEVLQHSSNIAEAIKVMDKFMPIFGTFMGKPMVHFKIVQKDGKSVLVEYFDKKLNIIKNAKIMTNHYIGKPSLGSENKTSFKRYDYINQRLKKDKTISIKQSFNILEKVSQKNTLWSNVYDLNSLTLYMKYQNDEIVKIDIKKFIEKSKDLELYSIDKFL